MSGQVIVLKRLASINDRFYCVSHTFNLTIAWSQVQDEKEGVEVALGLTVLLNGSNGK